MITREEKQHERGQQDRLYWLAIMSRIAEPVLTSCAARRLKVAMPIEANQPDRLTGPDASRTPFAHLEALARLLCGMAPWLETPQVDGQEETQRVRYADLARQAIDAITDPASPDYCNFTYSFQPIVDTAFLAQAILRAPTELWRKLDGRVQNNVVQAFKLTRTRKPWANNWLLFAAVIEAMLYAVGESDWDPMRIDYALTQHEQWYVGDGHYSDGPHFHADYYNSFVIHPLLLDILGTVGKCYPEWKSLRKHVIKRAQRYAEIQERLISPEGTFPPLGRSLAYRFGAFHLLAQVAMRGELPETLQPAQVRCALTAVIRRMVEMPGMFDEQGWLAIGFCGHHPEIGEFYISTGSLYLCSAVFLPLGLPSSNAFWQGEAAWTAKKAWDGVAIPRDHAQD